MTDQITVRLKAGNGGKGSQALWRNRRPYGGDGGKGGDVYVTGSTNVYDLTALASKPFYAAENGKDGLALNRYGTRGKDLLLELPLRTEIYKDGELVTTITENGQTEKLLKGGRGDKGNLTLKKHPTWTPLTEEERMGEEGIFTLVYKIDADILLIGYPNVGKSSLLNTLTQAKAKVGNYEFTTLTPKLGRMGTIKILDLPGLIDGTHEGKGLGTHFVQHTETATLIAHLVDSSALNAMTRYESLSKEITRIDSALSSKKTCVIITKTDEASPETLQELKTYFSKKKIPFVLCSVIDSESIEAVKHFLTEQLPIEEF